MRVLIVHHGRLPGPGRLCSGGALRANAHAELLSGAGHQVRCLARAQDEEGGFRSPADLRRLATMFEPDWILCVAPSEAPILRPVAPLVVDLYAPRLLEAAWEECQQEEAGRSLRAVAAADQVLFSNPRQRWFWLGILALSGWDIREFPGLLVPLCAPEGPTRQAPERPRLLMGGQPWPWLDPRETLDRAVQALAGQGEVVTVGLPEFPGVRALPSLPYDQWLELCARSTVALDRYAPNPERELALSFRQMDYLGCGLPLISAPEGVIASELAAWGAGWVEESLEDAIAAAMDPTLCEARAEAAAALGRHYRKELVGAPLLDYRPGRRERGPSVLRDSLRFAAAQERAEGERLRREEAEREVQAKRGEVEDLHGQIRALTSAVEASAAAVADVAAFRAETARVLGTRLSGEHTHREQLVRELEITRAELAKKDLELEALRSERGRLEGVIGRILGRGGR